MTREEIIAFIQENPLAFMATLDDGIPHVRGMMTCFAEESGLLFATGKDKSVYKQLEANPAIELCYYSAEENCQVRVCGQAEIIDDLDTKKRAVEKFTFLKPWIDCEGYDTMGLIRLSEGEATVWTQERAFEEKTFTRF
jgi:pyridoxamine 5'-phosphate oxidase